MRYDFRCEECMIRFEIEREMSEAGAPAACPRCGQAAQRIFALPQVIVRGESKNRSFKEYESTGLVPVPVKAKGMTPRRYERAHEKSFAREEAAWLRRKRAGEVDGGMRKIGEVPFQEFLAMKGKYKDEMKDGSPPSKEILKREGCLFRHED